MLSRDEMKAVIASGGSVLHGGRIITREADLPSEADLAAGDPERSAGVSAAIQAQIDQLQQQLRELRPAQPPASEPTEPQEPLPPPAAEEPPPAEKPAAKSKKTAEA